MEQHDLDQVKTIIANLDTANKKIPYFQDLQAHPVYGQFFMNLESEEIIAIQELTTAYMHEKIQALKTKGGEMFRRCYVLNQDAFRRFRELNGDDTQVNTEEFQTAGKHLEQQFYKFEWILTQNMMKKPQGLDKTIGAYYDIVYSFFPLYGQIK